MDQYTIFPVGIDANWHTPIQVDIPDPYLKNWLLDTGSLTERLQSHCRDLEVVVLGQRQAEPSPEEKQQIGITGSHCRDDDWQVREVILAGENRPWVFARSIIPHALCQSDLANLGNQPLGKLIFNDQRFKRSPFQIAQLSEPTVWLGKLAYAPARQLWGRRSVFCFQGMKMMVAEIFLPEAPAYKNIADLIGTLRRSGVD